MVTLADVLAWLKALGAPSNVDAWSMARLDVGRERVIGVFQEASYGDADMAIGGERTTLTRTKRVQVVLHWTKNARDTEAAAQALYDAIRAADRPAIGDSVASYIELQMPEPVDLGADESGVFERTVIFTIYYQ